MGELGHVHGGRRLSGRQRRTARTLSAFLPLRISGEKCADDLRRSSLLLGSLEKHWRGERPLQLVVCVREDERTAVAAGIRAYRNLDLRVVSEGDLVSELREPDGVSGWYRQMLLKLAFSKAAESDLYLTLDADVVCVRPISDRILVRGGRAVTQWESKRDHPGWWQDSSRLLQCEVDLETPGMGVTPNVLSREIAAGALGEIERLRGERSARVLLQHSDLSDFMWTEYSLYCLFGERAGLLPAFHLLDTEQRAAGLSLHVGFSLWTADAEAFARWDPARAVTESGRGFFLVCQSAIGPSVASIDEIETKLLPLLT